MAITISKPAATGTKLTGPEMPVGIQPVTVTAVKDLGFQPAFDKDKPDVPQIEVIFTSPSGAQISKRYTKSLHELATLPKLILAAGLQPADNFDAETLVGKNLTLVVAKKTVTMGKNAGGVKSAITALAPAQSGQVTANAPAAVPQARPLVDVGF